MEIIEVRNSKQMSSFLKLPLEIYSYTGSRHVMPLNLHMKMMMGKIGSKEKHFFIAMNAGRPVARLGIKTHVYNGKKALHFGFFECVLGNQDAVNALFKKARYSS